MIENNQNLDTELNVEKKKGYSSFLLIFLSLLLFGTGCFIFFQKEWILQQINKKPVEITINNEKDNTEKVVSSDDMKISLNIKEKEVVDNQVSNSNVDYFKLKLEGLFPFYEVSEVETLSFKDLIEKKFSVGEHKKLKEAFLKIEDKDIKELSTFNFAYQIKDLDAKALISKALVDGVVGDNALSLLKQLYENINGVQIKLDILKMEDKQTLLAYLTQKLYNDENLVKEVNKHLKKAALYFSNYFLLFSHKETKEYMTFKEYLTQDRDMIEEVLNIDVLPKFDLFIDYKGMAFEGERNMIKDLISEIQSSKIFNLANKGKLKKKQKEIYKKALVFIQKLEFYSTFLSIIEENKS